MISNPPETGVPMVASEEVDALENILLHSAGWLSASDLITGQHLAPTENAKRQLRATASESKWIISGFHGYKHLQQATPEEVKHFVAQMDSQSRKMSARAESIEQNYRKIYQVT